MVDATVCIAGAGMTSFGRHLDVSLGALARQAADAALADAALDPGAIDLVVSANAMAGLLQGQESVRGQVALAGGPLAGKPLVNVENACAGGATAVQVAAWALRAGAARHVLVIGAEKLFHPDKAATFRALASASDVAAHAGTDTRSMFMDFYAGRAQTHMSAHGTTAAQLAAVAAKNRMHGSLNPLAQFRSAVSVDEVLDSRLIAAPLTLLMCSPISDGAAALVLSRREALAPGAPVVALRGLAQSSGDGIGPEFRTISAVARRAYAEAGIQPSDIDLAEVHDATAIAEIEATEALGLVERGGGGPFAASGATALGGRVPVNPSGGLCSRGHPVGATGVAQLCELTWQLRGTCGARQVPGARIGVAENHGGLVGDDVAVAVVTVLERVA